MKEIRNLDGKLVCRINELKGVIEIALKDCKTLINFSPGGKIEVANKRGK